MEENTVFVGNKDIAVYIKAVMTKIEQSSFTFVKTRGRHVQKAIQLSTYLSHKKELKISEIELSPGIYQTKNKKDIISPIISLKLSK